jgi:hypothetical protein
MVYLIGVMAVIIHLFDCLFLPKDKLIVESGLTVMVPLRSITTKSLCRYRITKVPTVDFH